MHKCSICHEAKISDKYRYCSTCFEKKINHTHFLKLVEECLKILSPDIAEAYILGGEACEVEFEKREES